MESSSPTRDEDCFKYLVAEEQPADTFVGNLLLDGGFDLKYSSEDLSHLRFRILTPNESSEGPFFKIGGLDGRIVTAKILDREMICSSRLNDNCVFEMDVIIILNASRYFQLLKTCIEIEDVNDHAPTFPTQTFLQRMSESSQTGFSFLIPTAKDPDSKLYSIQNYRLFPKNENENESKRSTTFELTRKMSWNEGGMEEVRLVLKDLLDREQQEFYRFIVLAIDGGNPKRSGCLTVEVIVLDANDNKPKFEQSSFEIFLSEDAAPGSMLLQLKAHDEDAGLNGEVRYELAYNSQQEFGKLFSVTPDSGQVFLKSCVDYEGERRHMVLSVVAQDRGHNPQQSFATIFIHVKDINDNKPNISVSTLNGRKKAKMVENLEVVC
ncbi:hypothetical protein HELRODRAFT_89774 [Helobdella robusta]|uniref:Cadherin domain-containing protein n=1 Tax=Helobdella robusta TaxID=6412 RepID=T1G7H4_HELRO|nr:hypothetical protein HELRODRAFT_89774 [Helobdella robusta]ESN92172.1 hypothetical protein HELRODRAFT_89774 [Helobdella robusta]